MKYATRLGDPAKVRAQCVIVGVYEKGQLTASAAALNQAAGGYLKKVLARGDIKGKPEQLLLLHDVPNVNAARVLLVGLGKTQTVAPDTFDKAAKVVAGRLKGLQSKNLLCCLLDVPVKGRDVAWKTLRLVERFAAGLYKYTAMKGKKPEKGTQPEVLEFLLSGREDTDIATAAIKRGNALAAGLAAAKNLANTPANICHPAYIADQALQLAKTYASITTKIVEEKQMEALGMGAFMSVTRGSEQPGKLIVMTYNGAKGSKGDKEKPKPHILVGKGVTFDTGGISLKPGAGMHEMIYDMCGAASVFGAMTAIAKQRLPLNVIGVIAAAENMPSGKASRPGDIVKTMSGQTVEILNTDAEGRLVLCDALTYIGQFKPATVIDIATLTGACVVALGSQASALYANDEKLAAELIKASEDTHDKVWRMPLWDDYQKQLDSAFADIANIGGREAGSVTAACFLSRFTKKYRWAHLDIAGTAYQGSGPGKGATGRPVTLLVEYLNNIAT
ncbi:MAG: leucyl aminopeptidase [Pseudomonadales bacterium]